MRLLRAPFLVIDADRVVADGAVAVAGDRVAAAGPARRLARRFGVAGEDLGDVVLTPGLVNAHTHLELSALRGRLRPTADFAGWVRDQLAALERWSRADFVRSYRLGVRLALAAGTTAVGDVCRRRFLARAALRNPFRTVHYVEAIEPDADRAWGAGFEASGVATDALLHLMQTGRRTLCEFGFSPHAPYTVSAPLYREIVRRARALAEPVQTHLSETQAEVELLRDGAGPLADLLAKARRPFPFAKPPGRTPVAYLDRLGVLRPPLVAVHCNYLTRRDVETLSRRRVAVVFCPRSHAFFRHPPHPVRALLRAGVPVALGTDSLASALDLDVRAEMRAVVRSYGLSPRAAWRMATANGARAIFAARRGRRIRSDLTCRKAIDAPLRRWIREAGTLHEGAAADFTIFRGPAGAAPGDLPERLLDPAVRVAGVWVDGAPVGP